MYEGTKRPMLLWRTQRAILLVPRAFPTVRAGGGYKPFSCVMLAKFSCSYRKDISVLTLAVVQSPISSGMTR